MDIFHSIVKFFASGGVFMYPILIVAALAAAITVERYVTLRKLVVKNRNVWSQVEPVLDAGDFDKARDITGKDDASARHGTRPPRRRATRR